MAGWRVLPLATVLVATSAGLATTQAAAASSAWQLTSGSVKAPPGVATFNFAVADKAHLLLNDTAAATGNQDGNTMSASGTVQGVTGAFTYGGEPSCGGTTATVRLYFESVPPGSKFANTNYWWSDTAVATLANGGYTLAAAVDPTQAWSDWNGQPSSANPGEFTAAASNITAVGLSFGGGCFFENGVGTSDGSGSFTLESFSEPHSLYNSTVSPLPGNLPSVGFQATQTNELGNQVNLTSSTTSLGSVVVTMSSWACQTGSATDGTCATTPGAIFTEAITLNIYNANAPGSTLPGSLITSVTNTFNIPYRPSADPGCTNGGWDPPSCVHGLAANISFDFSASHITLPNSIVYGIAYSTSGYGPAPHGYTQPCNTAGPGGGDGCPYDSLNVAVSQDPTNLTAGSDPNPDTVFWNTATPGNYCDGGTAGTSIFRLDSPAPSNTCWSVGTAGTAPYYVPAVEFIDG